MRADAVVMSVHDAGLEDNERGVMEESVGRRLLKGEKV